MQFNAFKVKEPTGIQLYKTHIYLEGVEHKTVFFLNLSDYFGLIRLSIDGTKSLCKSTPHHGTEVLHKLRIFNLTKMTKIR